MVSHICGFLVFDCSRPRPVTRYPPLPVCVAREVGVPSFALEGVQAHGVKGAAVV